MQFRKTRTKLRENILLDRNFSERQSQLVKRCGYCGYESDDGADTCARCGVNFSDPDYNTLHLPKDFLKNLFRRPLNEWIGCLIAIPAAFIMSIAAFIFFGLLLSWLNFDHRSANLIMTGLAGFSGVFVGALFFPRSNRMFGNRIFGSILLLLIGLRFEFGFTMLPSTHGPLFSMTELVTTAIGGILATALHYLLKPGSRT